MSLILVIDDECGVQAVLQAMLRAAGHEVLSTASGRQALRFLASHKIDVVLTDILMPEMDGIEIIRDVVKNYPHIGVIAMSGGSSRLGGVEIMQLALFLGAHAVMMKPFSERDLLDAVAVAQSASKQAFQASSHG